MKLDTNDIYCEFILINKIKVEKEIETNNIVSFRHTKPSWTTHIVIVPKKHISNLLELTDFGLIAEIFEIIQNLVIKYDLNMTNFKIITNGGSFQDSKHLHFHLVSGEKIN